MKKPALFLLLLTYAFLLPAQVDLSRWGVPPADYSGITALGNGLYALVDDKQTGFALLSVAQDSLTGAVTDVVYGGFRDAGEESRDCEGIAFVPDWQTLFISGERDQQILEYSLSGAPTGRRLSVPEGFSRILPNYGFEALAYDAVSGRFWATTERPLRGDSLHLLVAFDRNLQPVDTLCYWPEPLSFSATGGTVVSGISALCAPGDGSLLVLEREANIPAGYLGARCRCRVFRYAGGKKTELADITTRFTLFDHSFANYEGLCPGIRLSDGRPTYLLISDSQHGYGIGPFRLRDWLTVIIPAR
ncbi:MAG: esterase-like activity of phytase family protein [Prevotellaceae bacterium]|nr:esterase-like activity of phytase family protein [Prevotellaceae bacterium]